MENGSSSSVSHVDQSFAGLVRDVVSIPNPQHTTNGRIGEAAILEWIMDWATRRTIEFEADPTWGIHFQVASPESDGLPGVLLSAHLDSDHLTEGSCTTVRINGNDLEYKGQVGLDDKTGVAICLSVVDRLLNGQGPRRFCVHVIFTVGEESGQKGAIRCPLARLIGCHVRHGLVIDRKTDGSGAPYDKDTNKAMRHAVVSYKDVSLLDQDSGNDLLEHLVAGMTAAGEPPRQGKIPTVHSPNNADALEWRGRWDAEVVAPRFAADSPPLAAAIVRYQKATQRVVDAMGRCKPEERVSGMYSEPRIGRYEAMREVRNCLENITIADKSLWFSCVNLSYDYDDSNNSVSLIELNTTAVIVMEFLAAFFGALPHHSYEVEH